MKLRRLLISLFALSLLLVTSIVSAQGSAGQGLEISPPLADIKADPGQTKSVQIYVRNVTQRTLIVTGEVNDFVAAGEDGQPKLLLDEGETSPYSIKEWVKTVPKVTLAASERKSISVSIEVPKNAGPGGHYGVVRFTGTPPELEGTGVSLSASVGTLILVNVSGNVVEKAKIAEIYTANQRGKKQSIFEYGPITIGLRLQNEGNVHFKPSGTVRVTNTLGKEVTTFKLNDKGTNVLPSSTRKYEQKLDKKLMFGRYRVQADVVYGTNSTILSATKSFWVIPYKLILIAIALIVFIIFLIRRYNRAIVNRASKKQNQNGSKQKQKQKQ